MPQLVLYNTLSGSKEPFNPIDPERLTVYVCGPTVYNYVHIGNGRPAVVFDVLVKLLRCMYPQVIYARNVTDIDDKINAAAHEAGESIQTLADRFTEAYEADMLSLDVTLPDITPRATHHISEIIEMIGELVDQGHAYANEDHVLFNVPSDSAYGTLARRSLQDMLDGARVEVAPYKQNAKDFVLWKPSTGDQPGWQSPWGKGRPGWHIECSAMIRKHLGKTIDIHGGGSDLTFPHHENEAAQSRCANQSDDYVRFWVHNGMLTLGDEKMSKSLGNVLTIRELAARHSGEVLRYALLSGQYRSQLAWSGDLLNQSQASLDSLYQALRDRPGADWVADKPRLENLSSNVVTALCDDLNSPEALAALHQLANELQRQTAQNKVDNARRELQAGAWLLGLLQQDAEQYFRGSQASGGLSDADIDALVLQRDEARAAKEFAKADAIRGQLADLGVDLEDLREGTRWRRM